MLTRRSFLATVGAFAGAAACQRAGTPQAGGTTAAAATSRRRVERVGIQLYSVRDDMQRDFPGTLARLSEIGYREVEFAGYFGRSPAEVRQILGTHRLAAPATHMPYELIATGWDKALDDAKAIGHQYVVVPWLAEDLRKSADSWRRVAAEFNRAGERARSRGLNFAYHNHEFEFKRTDGAVPFDILIAETDPALVSFEMDVYWVTFGGADPLAYLRQHPERFSMLHIKDSAGPPNHAQVDVGAGTIDFAAILRLDAQQRSAVKHVFVEHDKPADPLAFAKKSFDHLSALEY
jgi:sugar phosphate isomerase/epimerase